MSLSSWFGLVCCSWKILVILSEPFKSMEWSHMIYLRPTTCLRMSTTRRSRAHLLHWLAWWVTHVNTELIKYLASGIFSLFIYISEIVRRIIWKYLTVSKVMNIKTCGSWNEQFFFFLQTNNQANTKKGISLLCSNCNKLFLHVSLYNIIYFHFLNVKFL